MQSLNLKDLKEYAEVEVKTMTGLPQESREHCLFTLTGQIPPGLPAFQVTSLPIISIIIHQCHQHQN